MCCNTKEPSMIEFFSVSLTLSVYQKVCVHLHKWLWVLYIILTRLLILWGKKYLPGSNIGMFHDKACMFYVKSSLLWFVLQHLSFWTEEEQEIVLMLSSNSITYLLRKISEEKLFAVETVTYITIHTKCCWLSTTDGRTQQSMIVSSLDRDNKSF